MARAAAVREAEAELAKLDSRIELAQVLLAARRQRREDRAEQRLALEVRALELKPIAEAARERVDMLHEGVAAAERRLALSRRCLAESAPKLEALRTRRAVAEEQYRVETIQLGLLHERLRERKHQLMALQHRTLDQRVRIGLGAWRARHTREDAFLRWRRSIVLDRAAASAAAHTAVCAARIAE